MSTTKQVFNPLSGQFDTVTKTIDASTDVTGALPIANGGTGQITKAPAFDALSPMTTSGDVIYGGASGTGTRLAKGSDGQILTLVSGLPAWQPASSSALVNAISSSSGGFQTSSTSPVDITNLSVTITTTGGLVFIGMIADGTTNTAAIGAFRTGASAEALYYVLEGSTIIAQTHITSTISGETDVPPSSVGHYYVPTAGTYTFKAQAAVSNASAIAYAQNCKLIAWTI